jgi:tetratricopeptide (TPR) repeat protein
MSPIPSTNPSAPTAVVGRASAPTTPRPPAQEWTPVPMPTTPSPASRPSEPPVAASASARRRRSALPWVVALMVLILVAGYFALTKVRANRRLPERNAALQRGVRLWQEQKTDIAEAEFNAAASQMPRSALPHIYLSRIARERGDMTTAFNEAARAAEFEPRNSLAMRELGSVLLARGDFEGARRFFVRAVRVNPADRVAMGWLACSLQKLGDSTQAARWSLRAGPGAWSSCVE